MVMMAIKAGSLGAGFVSFGSLFVATPRGKTTDRSGGNYIVHR